MTGMIIFYITAIFDAAALIVMLGIALLNGLTFLRLRPPQPEALRPPQHEALRPVIHPSAETPLVSILIPARDEAVAIGATVRSLLAQTYSSFEVIILDDHSADGTGEIARVAAGGDARFQIISGQPLLEGWLGKSWACHQLSLMARGSVLVFADADVQWQPQALAALVALMLKTQADLLTVWSTQITVTWSERLIVPLMALAIFAYLPALLVHNLTSTAFAAANGQCLAFRRSAYQALGGHICVRGSVIEDMSFARQIKARGLCLRMADGAGLISCRMYRSWRDVRDGFAKNILAGYGGRVSLLALATVFHLLVFVVPAVWLLVGWLLPTHAAYPLVPLVLTLLGILVRGLTAGVTRQRLRDALWMPISALLMTRIAGQAVWWQWRYGGARWKGRTVSSSTSSNAGS